MKKEQNKEPKKRKRSLWTIFVVILTAVLVCAVWENTAIESQYYTISSPKIPAAFDGFRIAHISDLHNAQFGEDNEVLLDMLRQTKPDMIAITGDLIDSRRTDTAVALSFLRQAMEIAPCYYVTGNHESRIDAFSDFRKAAEELGVRVLSDEAVLLEKAGQTIWLFGVDDPGLSSSDQSDEACMVKKLEKLAGDEDFTILLSHRPELMDVYSRYGIDLVFSGHAHGGQIRLPLIGGLVAPNQGWFPEYDAGLFERGETRMIVSRGLGNSLFPLRFNNRPELIIVELKCEN